MSTMAILLSIQFVALLLILGAIVVIMNHFSKFTFVNIRIVLPVIGILAMGMVMISWIFQGGEISAYYLWPILVIVVLAGVMIKQKKTSAK
ncbi:hypothetical protein HNR44_002274 [Geomicrobium halophilum]|uniref:Uncharacterized protein n=1 Tax=Geomicrobium halophilum TaxID=549000 RepID=A0A841PVF3_9BACL|nr:hypothetical protein [Geomicrobium halophilum]MBB6450291.1 hypothetical protein [Geomicrobium halophilum]